MKNKKLFRLISILICLVSINTAYASEGNPDEIQYSHTASIIAHLSISGSTASINGSARGKYTDTTTTVIVSLQRKATGGSWTNIYTGTATSSGRVTAAVNDSVTVNTGYSYRVKTISFITDADGNILEQLTKYSTVISI